MLFQLALYILHVVKVRCGNSDFLDLNYRIKWHLKQHWADGVGGGPSKPLPPVTTLPGSPETLNSSSPATEA